MMDLRHYELIASSSILVGVRGCSYGLEKTSMDSNEGARACYELIMPYIHHTQPLWQPFSWDFTQQIKCLPPKMALQQLQKRSNPNAWHIP